MKHLAGLLALFAVSPLLANEFDAVVCRGVTDHTDPVSYAVNEPIVFTLSFDEAPDCLFAGDYRLDWKRQGDDGLETTGSIPLDGKTPLEIATSLDRPGFVFVTADVIRIADGSPVARDVVARGAETWEGLSKELHFALGAGVEVEKVGPAREEPADFDEFWARQKARLTAVPVRAVEKPVDFGDADFDFKAVRVDCAGPRPVWGVLAIPKNAQPKSLKAVLEVHGYGVFRQGRPWGTRQGAIVFSINAHGVDPTCSDEEYAAFEDGIRTPNCNYAMSTYQNEYPEGCYFNGMALRVIRAFDYLRTRPEWNGHDLEVEGGSQGGMQSVWAASLVDDLTEARPEVPWGCDHGAGEVAGRLRSPWHVPYSPGLNYYDSVFHARRAKCFVDIKRAGLGDDVCVPSGIMALFNNLPSDRRRILWIQGARHGYIPPEPRQEREIRSTSADDGLVRLGAVSPYGEVSPFVFKGSLMRLELVDDSRGLAAGDPSIHAQIRNVATGEVLSSFGESCYYYSAFTEEGRVYVTATERSVGTGEFCGSRIRFFSSDDLVHWEERTLLERPGWKFFNTTLTKGPDGYLLALETNTPQGWVPFTLVFATSKDLVSWEFLGDEYAYPKDRYCGGPFLFWHKGFYYLSLVTSERGGYTTTIWRSCDLKSWEGAAANPILTWENPEERKIAPHAVGMTEPLIAQIRDTKVLSASDLEFCELNGCVHLNYIIGNQAGFYYTVESRFEGTLDELLARWFPISR